MPSTWVKTEEAVGKIKSAITKVKTPEPSDPFQRWRVQILREISKMEEYVSAKARKERKESSDSD